METKKPLYQFNFGHFLFSIEREWLEYYPWLKSMFGVDNGFRECYVLEENLIHYLKHVKPHVIRNLGNAFQNMLNSSLSEVPCTNLEQIESFLKNGPGMTPDLDIYYKCQHCSVRTWDRRIYKYKKEPLTHTIHQSNQYHVMCKRCGNMWSTTTDFDGGVYCSDSSNNYCNHEWKKI